MQDLWKLPMNTPIIPDPAHPSRPLSGRNARVMLKRLLAYSGLEFPRHRHLYSCRKGFSTALKEAGISRDDIAHLCRWSNRDSRMEMVNTYAFQWPHLALAAMLKKGPWCEIEEIHAPVPPPHWCRWFQVVSPALGGCRRCAGGL